MFRNFLVRLFNRGKFLPPTLEVLVTNLGETNQTFAYPIPCYAETSVWEVASEAAERYRLMLATDCIWTLKAEDTVLSPNVRVGNIIWPNKDMPLARLYLWKPGVHNFIEGADYMMVRL